LKQPYSNYKSAQLHLRNRLARLCNIKATNSLLQHKKGRYRQIYFLAFIYTAEGFSFAKISNLAIISNACAD